MTLLPHLATKSPPNLMPKTPQKKWQHLVYLPLNVVLIPPALRLPLLRVAGWALHPLESSSGEFDDEFGDFSQLLLVDSYTHIDRSVRHDI